MSLATRCTACGTVFRVVQDQLKVSEGWVRCGRCSEVFNALEGLFDLERDVPPQGSAATTTTTESWDLVSSSESASTNRGADEWPTGSLVEKLDAQLFPPRKGEASAKPATQVAERDRVEFANARYDPELLTDEADSTPAHALHSAPEMPPVPAGPVIAPEFIRHAERRARWQTPLARIALSFAAVVLLAALTLQTVHHYRDLIAARWPQTGTALRAWCRAADCSIEPARRIDDISVESTALTRAAGPDMFRFSVVLRNRGPMALALPSVDLSLTDSAGQLLARRAFHATDFGPASKLLQPGTETGLQLLLLVANLRVAGYTVEIFYP
jgi:predicted Zn finger-like uncharacterized protein